MSRLQHFTMEAVEWDSWIETQDLATATPEQIAVLEESTPTAKTSPYYLLLVQDVDALRARSRLFNAVMYRPRGLSRAERELSTVITSRINGCYYCAAIHAERFVQLTKEKELMQRILDEGVDTPLPPRLQAITDYARKLTETPDQITSEDAEPLRAHGFSDLEILDLTHAVAMFAWANRLLQTLGEPRLAEPAA